MIGSDTSVARHRFRTASRAEQLAMAQQNLVQHKGSGEQERSDDSNRVERSET